MKCWCEEINYKCIKCEIEGKKEGLVSDNKTLINAAIFLLEREINGNELKEYAKIDKILESRGVDISDYL